MHLTFVVSYLYINIALYIFKKKWLNFLTKNDENIL